MKIVTLTTDMGLSDHYAASLKGTLYSLDPEIGIVDISHLVRPFDIVQASFMVRNVYRDFPAGTVHVIGVDSEPVINPLDGSYPAIMKIEKQFFVANDNGVFELLLQQREHEGFWHIDDVLSRPGFHFPVKNIFLPTAVKLANGTSPDELGSSSESWKKAYMINPVVEQNLIKGAIIHIDHFGNAITNITREEFYRFGDSTPFTIRFRRKEYFIDVISGMYNEVAPGEKLALFNSSGLLEIAINKGARGVTGGADSLFGLHVGDMIRVEFTPPGSAETINSLF